MKKTLFFRLGLCFIIALVCFSSCTSIKQLRYFNDLPDSPVVNLPPMVQKERFIQSGDRLSVTIGAVDGAAAEFFNRYGGENTSGGSGGRAGGQEVIGYLVDANGDLDWPLIGKVRVVGLTSLQVEHLLVEKLTPYLKEPLVSVKFYTFKFTVLGEVRQPGTITLPMQRTTILDALGAAHDLPNSAKREGIRIYRDYNGKRTVFMVDLRKQSLLNDPEKFQVMHNDVIYVQPRISRLVSEEARFYVQLATLAFTILALTRRF